MTRKSTLFLLAGIMILALGLRLYGLSWGMVSGNNPDNSYHPDEALYVLLSVMLYGDGVQPKHFIYGGTLLYAIIFGIFRLAMMLHPLVGGFNAMADTLIVGRFLMVLVSLSTILLMYRVGRFWFGRAGGLLTALMLAIMPSSIVWAQRLKPDAVAALFVALMLYIAIRILDRGETKITRFVALAALLSGAMLAFRLPLLIFGLVPVVAVVQRASCNTPRDVIRVLFPAPFLLYLFLVPLAYAVLSPQSILYPRMLMAGLGELANYQTGPFPDAMNRGPRIVQYWWSILHQSTGYPIYFAALGGLVMLVRERHAVLPTLLTGFVPHLLSLAFVSWVVVRYTLPVVPFFALLSAYFLRRLGDLVSKPAALGAIALTVCLTLAADLAFLNLEAKRNIRLEVADGLESTIPPSGCVLMIRRYVEENFYNPEPGPALCTIVLDIPTGFVDKEGAPAGFYDYYSGVFEDQPVTHVLLHEDYYASVIRLGDDYPLARDREFYRAMLDHRFELVEEFREPPTLLGIDFSAWFRSQDYRFVNPGYRLYRKSDRP